METIVLYPIPGIGHLISMVELGKLLLSHNPSLSITILIPTLPFDNPNSTSSYISSVSASFPSISFHSLPAAPLLGDPSNYPHFVQIFFENVRSNKSHVHQFLQSLSLSYTVSAFILDFFCYPALEVAQSFQIPTYFFFTSSASTLACILNFPEFDKIASQGFRTLGTTPVEIPGLWSVPADHIMDEMQDRGVTFDECVQMGAHLPRSNGIIVNTFEVLEPRAVKALKEGTCLRGTLVPPIYCIGPLISGEKKKGEERNECLSWLDLQPKGSVVYLSFGSFGSFSGKQITEIATGLERSGIRFLWVVRAPPSEDKAKQFLPPSDPNLDSILPGGFLDRTKGRGLVVKSWAPQIAVLKHESVGGFVTHCGWNSIIEAVSAGVPMIAWPLYAEQRLNKIMLVEEIKVALPLHEFEEQFVRSDEIERRVKQIINSGEGDALRKRVLELSHEVKVTLNEGGISKVALARLVESWKR